MDNIFYFTIFFVFAAALVSFIIQRWALDRCLKHFSNFNVSIEQEGRDRHDHQQDDRQDPDRQREAGVDETERVHRPNALNLP